MSYSLQTKTVDSTEPRMSQRHYENLGVHVTNSDAAKNLGTSHATSLSSSVSIVRGANGGLLMRSHSIPIVTGANRGSETRNDVSGTDKDWTLHGILQLSVHFVAAPLLPFTSAIFGVVWMRMRLRTSYQCD